MTDGWVAEASCAPRNRPEGMTERDWTDQFFPPRGRNATAAKAICHRCPVKAECLAASLDDGFELGTWGGRSERQRRAVGTRVKVRSSGHGTEARYRLHLLDGDEPCPFCRGAHNAAERRRRLDRLNRLEEAS